MIIDNHPAPLIFRTLSQRPLFLRRLCKVFLALSLLLRALAAGLRDVFFFFCFIISAFDLYRSWQQITKPFPRHYGSS